MTFENERKKIEVDKWWEGNKNISDEVKDGKKNSLWDIKEKIMKWLPNDNTRNKVHMKQHIMINRGRNTSNKNER